MRRRSDRRRPPARHLVVTLAAAGVLLWAVLPAAAQDVTEPSLKAAFVYNLAKFTEWPADALPPGSPFVACTVGDRSVPEALERTARGRLLLGRPVTVIRLTPNASARACHLLYTSGLASTQVAPMIEAARGLPILTVVDIDAAARAPGIAHLFVENGKLRFNLDHGLAKRSRLKLSSRLLPLAKRLYDDDGAGVTQ